MGKKLNLKEEYIKYCEKERDSIIADSALSGKITEEDKKWVGYYNYFIEEAKHDRFERYIYQKMMEDIIYSNSSIGIYGE